MKFEISILTGILICVLAASPQRVAAAHSHEGTNNEVLDGELKRLNKVIKAQGLYLRDKTNRLDSISRSYSGLPESETARRWQTAMELSEGYLPLRADSALKYAEAPLDVALRASDRDKELRSRIAKVNALSTCGIFTHAVSVFSSLPSEGMPVDMRVAYWTAGRKLYGYMRVYVEGEEFFYKNYTARYLEYDDSLASHLPENDKTRQFYVAERLVSQGNYAEAKEMLLKLCTTLPEESNLYGMASFQLARAEQSEGNQIGYATYLTKAAISDIKGGVMDGMALPTLAEWLYKEGELNLAFQYINSSLEDAMRGNVRMRTVSIARLLPMIDEAYREKINASRDELMVYFLLVTFLLIVSAALLVVLFRMNKRSSEKTRKLARTSELQESYIGHFIGLCSTYANRLQSLQKLVGRKLASGQADELQKMIKSGKFGEDQNEEFYKIFDSAFLDIYPDFIENVNELLRPEEALELKKERELSAELRIYAFVRLGVDESTRIAQMLNYSVSTVYAYRNRMRNRAIDRENFDRDVMNIGKGKGEKG